MMRDKLEFESQKSKNSDDYLIEQTDLAITELVFPKYHIQKAYNYYHGTRDPELFRHLEENYGLSNPTSITFTPLVKKHVDSLIGEYLDIPLLPKVSCKDKETLSNIVRDKQLKIYEEVLNTLKYKLNHSAMQVLTGLNPDPAIQKDIDKLTQELETNFLSDYEIAALNVVDYLLQSRTVDFKNKLKTLLLDLLIAGLAFYRVTPNRENVNIEVLNPLQVFTDYNPEAVYRKDDYRVVVVKYLSIYQILNKYGDKLDAIGLDKLKGNLASFITDNNGYYIRGGNDPTGYPSMPGLISYTDITPGIPRGNLNTQYYAQSRLIPVYEVEWITTNKVGKEYIMDRYETVRISSDIYILSGKSESVIRSIDNPSYCGLSVNGIYYQDRNSEPYSLMLATADLQDKYDLLFFFRDNLIANSGTVGDWLDVSLLPTFLGVDVTERVQKFLAYKKGGVALIDTSQEGRAYNANTVYAGYDDSLRALAIQAIELAIERTEQVCSSITGVFRERLNGIQLRDAVTNVAAGVRNSFTITKQYYQQMDTLTVGMLSDALDIAKIVYKNGLTGTLILGDKSLKIFTALPEHFTITDYDIHITSSSETVKQIEEIRMLTAELTKAGQVSPDILMEVVTARSLTELKRNVNKAIAKQKAENDQLTKLSELNEELTKQLKETTKQLDKATSKVEQLNDRKMQLEESRIKMENELGWFVARQKADADRQLIDVKNKLIDAEVALLYDDNKHNDEIKNI